MKKSTTEVIQCSLAEKRFTEIVIERYLLTVKTEGILGLLGLVTDKGHDYEMWIAYMNEDRLGGFVAKCDAWQLCRHAFHAVLSSLEIGVNGDEYFVNIIELGVPGNGETIFVNDGNGICRNLADFAPAPETITRVL
jgi:hypothetical protein